MQVFLDSFSAQKTMSNQPTIVTETSYMYKSFHKCVETHGMPPGRDYCKYFNDNARLVIILSKVF